MIRRGVQIVVAALVCAAAEGCVVGGPEPKDFADLLHRLAPVPVCQHRYEGAATAGRRRAIVTCEGDARVDRPRMTEAALGAARSMNPGGTFVVLTEVTSPADEFNVQCDAVPIVPWARPGFVDRRWKRRVCRLEPAGLGGHSLTLVVEFDGAAGPSEHG